MNFTALILALVAVSAVGGAPGGDLDLVIVNLNLTAAEDRGSQKLLRTLRDIDPQVDVRVVHWLDLVTKAGALDGAEAIVLSPQGTPWGEYPAQQLQALSEVVRSTAVPVLGICGGHQFLGLTFGVQVAPIRGEIKGKTYRGMFRERGYTTIETVTADPLLDSAPGKKVKVWENHVEEVKSLPEGFVLLMRGKDSITQAMRHESRPIYGVQFHPEHFTRERPFGRGLLVRFLGLSRREAAAGASKPSVVDPTGGAPIRETTSPGP